MDSELKARRAACTTFIGGDGPIDPAKLLATIPADVDMDAYGDGGVVEALEAYVADLLGTEAAVFLPSGTMAQGATLRVHADERGSRTVLWHPSCHLAHHELDGPERIHHLVGRAVGPESTLLTLKDLEAVAEPFAALLLELPAREIGGQLPTWAELEEQTAWARGRGGALHLDGARLWEASAGYGRSPAEVVALFDTAYVSFYKGIGALAGCCVVGSASHVAQVREWRRRLGGTLFGLWPAAATALALIPERLVEMGGRFTHATAIAAALADVEGITVVPKVPQAPMMHLLLRVDAARYEANATALAESERVWAWPKAMPTIDPGLVRVELTVGRATCAIEVADLVRYLQLLVA